MSEKYKTWYSIFFGLGGISLLVWFGAMQYAVNAHAARLAIIETKGTAVATTHIAVDDAFNAATTAQITELRRDVEDVKRMAATLARIEQKLDSHMQGRP